MKIEDKYQSLLLESLEDLMYKISLELEKLKGQPMTQKRKELTQKLKKLETLQHLISNFGAY